MNKKQKAIYEEMVAKIVEQNEEAVIFPDYAEALIGYVTIFNKVHATYDRQTCLEILMKRDGMTWEEAEDFFSFNTEGSFLGEFTPAILNRHEPMEVSKPSKPKKIKSKKK